MTKLSAKKTKNNIKLFFSIPLIILVLIYINAPAYSQSDLFNTLTSNEGLSQSTVTCIMQDKTGFMWFGTRNGLNRYDGHTFRVYKNDPADTNTINGNGIVQIIQDKAGDLWITHNNNKGVSKFNPSTETFKRFTHNNNDSTSLSSNTINHIMEDSDGNIWMATDSVVNLLHKGEIGKDKVLFKHIDVSSMEGLRLSWIHENRDGDIILFGSRIYKLEKRDYSLKAISDTISPNDASHSIISLIEDEDGNIFFGSEFAGNVKLSYIKETKRYIQDYQNKFNVTPASKNFVLEDYKNRLWVATSNNGLFLFDEHSRQYKNYIHYENDRNSISDNSLNCLYVDNSGVLWIGTYSKGLCSYNLHKKQFYHINKNEASEISLNDNVISSIHSTKPNELWVGLENGGGVDRILLEDGEPKQIIHYTNEPNNKNSIGSNNTFCLVQRKNHEVWLGGITGFISVIYPEVPESGKIERIKTYSDISWTFSILEDSDQNMWGGTWGMGIWKYSEKSDSFKYYSHDPDDSLSIIDNIVWALFEDKKGNLWIGGRENGLSILSAELRDSEKLKFINYQNSNNDSTSLSNNTINAFCQDKNGNIWIGSDYGLNKVSAKILQSNNLHELSFQSYHVADGLPSETIMGIIEDNHHNLWLSTSKGLSFFNVSTNTFKNYSIKDGSQSNEFLHNAYFKDERGKIYFGGINGITAFYPDSIKDNLFDARPVITGIKLFNKSIKIGEKVNGDVILEKAITETTEITLSHLNNVIEFYFAAAHYVEPKNNQYAYKMENFDKDWNYVGNKNNATYTNMDPGVYAFKVKVSNNDGVWSKDVVSINIIVVPPYWQTWWFRTIIIFLISGLIFSVYLIRVRSIRNKNAELEDLVKKRTWQLNEKNEEILVQNEELTHHRNNLKKLVAERTEKLEHALLKSKESDELKSAFFANMSHEIRTPMNAISGFSSLLSEDGLTGDEKAGYIEIIQSNSNTLIKIIDEIIDLSLIEANQLKLTSEVFELNVLIDHIYSFYSLSNKKSNLLIKKNNTLYNKKLKLNSDKTRINQIITNLMENAYKFTEEGIIELGVYSKDNNLNIYVKDTGRGISASQMDLIFKRFTKVEENDAVWVQGLGLGLAISKNIANALGAEIIVNSVKGEGSVFTLSIPMHNLISHNEIEVPQLEKPSPNKWEGKTILIAEDVEANYLYLEKVLKNTQTNIIWAKNGKEALSLVLENSNVDLILMDIKMPILNGYDAAKKIKEHNPKQIIVAQTAYSRPEERVKFFDDNFDDYLSKPITLVDLVMVLEKFL